MESGRNHVLDVCSVPWLIVVISTDLVLRLSGEMPFLETDLIVGANGLATEDGRDNPRFFITNAISLSGKWPYSLQ